MNKTRGQSSGLRAVVLILGAVISCADGQGQAPGASSTGPSRGDDPSTIPSVMSGCTDRDGDGYGVGCTLGPDCNDDDPTATTQCRQCRNPATGCACGPDETPVPCNLETGTTETGPDGICRLGQRLCRDGMWSQCEAFTTGDSSRFVGVVSVCAGACDPTCHHTLDCVTASDTLPAGSTVVIANLPQAVFCPAGAAAGGVQPACENRPGGPYVRTAATLGWIDACAASGSVVVLPGADEGIATVPIPFSFSYWGVPYRTVNVNPNGVAEFATAASQWVNTALPAPSAPNSVFAFWDDLVLRTGICTGTVGVSPNRRTALEWADAGFYPTPDAATHLSFEIVLNEATQAVDVLYNTMHGSASLSSGGSATIGVQEGGGTRFDLVGYNTTGVVADGMGFRWSPTSNDQYCTPGTYTRVFDASCPASAIPTIPSWGSLNFSSLVTGGSAIHMEMRAADTTAGLASATPIRLPDAPRATTSTPVTTGYDLGDILYAAMPHLSHARFVQITSTFDPGPDSNLAPTLGSIEVQFRCRPVETPFRCQAGSSCLTSGVCRRGAISCTHPVTPVCVDAGPLPAGTNCGVQRVCDSTGACVPCNEGASCDTGNPCEFGRISCGTGAPVCARVGYTAAGATCAFGTGAYTRDVSSLGWIDACAVPGASVLLHSDLDDTATLTLPFAFRFYGTLRTQAAVSANGAIGFLTVPNTWTNSGLPAVGMPDSIMPFWTDLQTSSAGICVATIGAAPGRLHVVEWANADFQNRSTSGPVGAALNFEVVLEEATQAVDVLYGTMTGDVRATGSVATVGIQRGDLTAYDQYEYNTANSVRANSSIRWTPPISSICNGTGTCTACTTTEVCDGLDNNCNALIDESIPPITCGVGACVRSAPGCVRGAVPTCTPGTPTAELCDGIDNDCNGIIDDGLVQTCYGGPGGTVGVGICRSGLQTCSAGVWGVCVGDVRPATETCDGVDNNCDGLVDNGLTRSCYTGLVGTSGIGSCRPGSQTCSAGVWGVACVGQILPALEVCDAVDNNCDGIVDNGIVAINCGVGACARTVAGCASGAVPTCTPGAPTAEICDGIDNNCNGIIDDGLVRGCYTGAAGTAGVGTCRAGTQTCSAGVWAVACSGQVVPAAEVCDNADNNCDGMIDNVTRSCYTGAAGTSGVGICSPGTQSCSAGVWSATCTGQVLAATETCDGIDNNCDGLVDNGVTRSCYTGSAGTAGVGTCHAGTQTCAAGIWGATCSGQVIPVGEVCDNIDNNCDGLVDNGVTRSCYTGAAGTSGVGICSPGTQSCSAGAWSATCSGQVLAAAETCDNIDNNCDGLVDNGVTRSCYTGAAGTSGVGACHGGTQTCSAGAWGATCSGQVVPVTEVCNDHVDNNCDGSVDENCTGNITCPGDQTMYAGDTATFNVTHTGMINSYAWSLLSFPVGGDAVLTWGPTPPTAATETFRPLIVGVYRVQVTAIDAEAGSHTCAFNVTANSHGLRVELTWNGTGDVDIHLHNNVSGAWFTAPNDTFYANLAPAWGAVQDVDNVVANGPENTRMAAPIVGHTYTVAVHNYANAAGRLATVKVYCRATSGITPDAVYVSAPLTGASAGNCTGNTFWRVTNVTVNADGSCTLVPILSYNTSSQACTTR